MSINCGVLTKPGTSKVFKFEEIINDFNDVDNDNVGDIVIRTLSLHGVLFFNDEKVSINFSFSIEDLEKFKYTRISKSAYADTFTYQVTDNSNNKKLSNMATMTINVNAYDNQPPTIGNNELTIAFGQTKVYTVQDFTSNTTPAYSDPEGDGPFKLKITSLPATGELRFNNILVVINDEIFFTDVAKGFLTYIPNIANTAGYVGDVFNFEVSDLGSQTFSS